MASSSNRFALDCPSIKVFNLLFIIKDVASLALPSPSAWRYRASLADRQAYKYAHIYSCTRQNARLRACWGLRSVSLCACTCSRVRGAALTVRRVAREAENDDDDGGSDGGCYGSKSTSVWVRRNGYGWVSVRYGSAREREDV